MIEVSRRLNEFAGCPDLHQYNTNKNPVIVTGFLLFHTRRLLQSSQGTILFTLAYTPKRNRVNAGKGLVRYSFVRFYPEIFG